MSKRLRGIIGCKDPNLLFVTLSVLVAKPKKTTLHGGQSRSWSAEQGKESKIKSLAAHAPRKLDKNHVTHLQAFANLASGLLDRKRSEEHLQA